MTENSYYLGISERSKLIFFIGMEYTLENQPHREYIANIVAINESPMTVAARNANPSSNSLPFFINETEAKKYLSDKMQEK